MKTILLIFVAAICTVQICLSQARLGSYQWKVVLKVVDDDGKPVEAAQASVEYGSPKEGGNPDPFQPNNWAVAGLTDANGSFTASHKDWAYGLGIQVQKAGYYPTLISYTLFIPGQFDDNKVETNRNPTLIVPLKKRGAPIPMYARKAKLEIPEVDKPIGFDLVQYDWVAPYGKGKQSDFIFQAQRRFVKRNDFDSSLKITFPNQSDGLHPIAISKFIPQMGAVADGELRVSAIAPTNGYISELLKTVSITPSGRKNDEDDNQDYYFRVRTAQDENGTITNALYGKIYGDFTTDVINSKSMKIYFTYYLNPESNSRNTEFDPKRNLFGKLSSLEQIYAP
jgi:hypothetical protein